MSQPEIVFPPKLELANLPTSFRCLKNLTRYLKKNWGHAPNIWLKSDDQTGSSMSGNKVRKLEYLLADAVRNQSNVVVTCGGIQSNHCRATAMACAQLGLRSHLILRCGDNDGDSDSPDGNWFLDCLTGAQLTLVPKPEYVVKLNSIFADIEAQYCEQGQNPYLIPTGGSNEIGLWGYISAAKELLEDFEREKIEPEVVVCATGSAGTQGGLTIGFNLFASNVDVLGMAVCDSNTYFSQKIEQDFLAWQEKYQLSLTSDLNIQTLDTYIGPGYAKGYDAIYETISLAASLEGIILDPVYTAKAFHGMLSEIKNGPFKNLENIVFVHTGGTFGLFPHKQHFSFND